MACKITFITLAIFLLVALSEAAPADKPNEKRQAEPSAKDDLEAGNDKDDLKPAASHWGGYGGHWGGYGGYGVYGGYPYYGSSYWGYPGYGYGYGYGYGWPGYGFGHHGYWW